MLLGFVIILVAIFISIYEVPKMWKTKQKKEIYFFITLLSMATVLSILKANDIPIPNPLVGIRQVYEPIGEVILNVLKP